MQDFPFPTSLSLSCSFATSQTPLPRCLLPQQLWRSLALSSNALSQKGNFLNSTPRLHPKWCNHTLWVVNSGRGERVSLKIASGQGRPALCQPVWITAQYDRSIRAFLGALVTRLSLCMSRAMDKMQTLWAILSNHPPLCKKHPDSQRLETPAWENYKSQHPDDDGRNSSKFLHWILSPNFQ